MACEAEQQALNDALAALGQGYLDLQALLANAQAAQAALDACLNPNPDPDPNTNAWPAKKAKPKKKKGKK